jgi:hypothetical protein
MANNMDTTLTIAKLDEQSFNKLKEIFNDGTNEYYTDIKNAITQMYGDVDTNSLEWWYEHIGSKWLTIESSIDGEFEESVQLYLTSAWDVPTPFLEKLRDILVEINKDVVLYGTYQDESLDPQGAFVFGYEYDDMEDLDIEIDWDKYWGDDNADDEGEYREWVYQQVLDHSDSLYESYLQVVKERKEDEESE